jgi:hypothetical protein
VPSHAILNSAPAVPSRASISDDLFAVLGTRRLNIFDIEEGPYSNIRYIRV